MQFYIENFRKLFANLSVNLCGPLW